MKMLTQQNRNRSKTQLGKAINERGNSFSKLFLLAVLFAIAKELEQESITYLQCLESVVVLNRL